MDLSKVELPSPLLSSVSKLSEAILTKPIARAGSLGSTRGLPVAVDVILPQSSGQLRLLLSNLLLATLAVSWSGFFKSSFEEGFVASALRREKLLRLYRFAFDFLEPSGRQEV